jgi:hypothetical protein
LIEEAVHLFGGEDGRNAFGKLWSGNEARGIFLQEAFADTVFEKRAEGSKLARDGTFLKAVVVEVADEFADGGVCDGAEGRRVKTGWRKVGDELAEVLAIIGYCVGRRVLYGL